jgi:hypothetical protein
MSKRKTVNVDLMLEKFNQILASDMVPQDAKIGICTAAETLLFEANRYSGFRYLNMTYNARTEHYDVDPDTNYNRRYFAKAV